MTAVIVIAFCFIRPLNNVVYAPKIKHADKEHAPPRLGREPWSWLGPVLSVKEEGLVRMIGVDAAIFLRFSKMCRNIFLSLTVVGCGIMVPVNLVIGHRETKSFSDVLALTRITPQYLTESDGFWAYVVVAYLFDIIICFFLWYNYRAVTRIRRSYYESEDYVRSLYSRTLLLTQLPRDGRSDEGIVRIAEQIKHVSDPPRAAIARNAKDLPKMMEEYETDLFILEEILAKYLKDPDNRPRTRPTTKAPKKWASYEKGQQVDAIEYHYGRLKMLATRIRETRESIDSRDAEPYGFASYHSISDAHRVAFAARKKAPKGLEVRLAPQPADLIWRNLSMTSKDRNWRNIRNNFWVALLTVGYIPLNVLSAVFLSNLSHLGLVWPAFQTSLQAHPKLWGVVQGIAAPAISQLFFLFLPSIFRRLSNNAGDLTKTSRERHVMHKLFTFFVLNNLVVYSVFSAIWTYIAAVNTRSKSAGAGSAIVDVPLFKILIASLETMATFWLTWLLQRNLGTATDLIQLLPLVSRAFKKWTGSPTPRELQEYTKPQGFEYASYYNYFLFYATVTLCYAPLQPLVLPVTALYFSLDSYGKKYLLMYVFTTKYESGGKFWRVVFNRMLFNALFGNLLVALVVGAQGSTWAMLISLAPLPFLLLGFKIYCKRTFDTKSEFYTTRDDINGGLENGAASSTAARPDRVHKKFGNPVLYKHLPEIMVRPDAAPLLPEILGSSLDQDVFSAAGSGYGDVYLVDLDTGRGRTEDLINSSPRSESRDSDRTRVDGSGTSYPAGYHKTTSAREHSPADSLRSMDLGLHRGISHESDGRSMLLSSAARMGYGPVPTPGDEDTSYDAFRRAR